MGRGAHDDRAPIPGMGPRMALGRWLPRPAIWSEREPANERRAHTQPGTRVPGLAGLALGVAGVLLVSVLSLRIGSIDVSTADAWNALTRYDPASYEQTVVRSLRVPRTAVALAVGAALAVVGAVMQGVTRNPLADPFILGVSSGASFAIVTAIYAFGVVAPAGYLWFSFAGALAASALVFLIGAAGHGGPTPVKLALAGVVVSAWTSALLLARRETYDVVRFWLAGSVVDRDMRAFAAMLPILLGGALTCVLLGHQLNVLSMGDETARSLGMRVGRTRLLCSALVAVVTAAAVAIAGPIGFVGLAIPHMARAIVGPDYRWVLPMSLLFGAVFLTAADVVGRVVVRPAEIEVGIISALVGAPVMVALARRSRS
jgi:iron-siderophore transport system permease protein